MTHEEPLSFMIAVCTLRRPQQLDQTLSCLVAQARTVDAAIELLVVDNDAKGSALETARRHDVLYIREPRPGLGWARNRALSAARAARPRIDALIFFDDDQTPTARWLAALLTAHRRHPNDVLSGPVQPCLDFELPGWAAGGWPWSRPSRRDGEELKTTGDGNVLIPRSVFLTTTCVYSKAFAQGMGQDADLFYRLRRQGVTLRHVSGASATEDVPPARRSEDWAMNRARLAADAWSRVMWANSPRPRSRIALALARRWLRSRRPLAKQRTSQHQTRARIAAAEVTILKQHLRRFPGTLNGNRERTRPDL